MRVLMVTSYVVSCSFYGWMSDSILIVVWPSFSSSCSLSFAISFSFLFVLFLGMQSSGSSMRSAKASALSGDTDSQLLGIVINDLVNHVGIIRTSPERETQVQKMLTVSKLLVP